MSNIFELKEANDIAKFLGIRFKLHTLRRFDNVGINRYGVSNNTIFFYPLNDGFPTSGFEFIKGKNVVINNSDEFSQISNLDEILIQMVRLYDKALDNGIVMDPYFFMLELKDEPVKDYHGSAELIITDKAIRNQKLDESNFYEANKHFINEFLDHFIGWNFGVSVNRSAVLKQELEELNTKVIEMGIREASVSGLDVYGSTEAIGGLQHYKLPTTISNPKKNTYKKEKNDTSWLEAHFNIVPYNK